MYCRSLERATLPRLKLTPRSFDTMFDVTNVTFGPFGTPQHITHPGSTSPARVEMIQNFCSLHISEGIEAQLLESAAEVPPRDAAAPVPVQGFERPQRSWPFLAVAAGAVVTSAVCASHKLAQLGPDASEGVLRASFSQGKIDLEIDIEIDR